MLLVKHASHKQELGNRLGLRVMMVMMMMMMLHDVWVKVISRNWETDQNEGLE